MALLKLDATDSQKRDRSHWRQGLDRPIALLRHEPPQLQRSGLVFEDDWDELDYLKHARLQTESGKVFALVRHLGSPQAGTEVVTRDDSTDLARDLDDALQALGMGRDDVLWEHPAIVRARIFGEIEADLRKGRLALWLTAALLGLALALTVGLTWNALPTGGTVPLRIVVPIVLMLPLAVLAILEHAIALPKHLRFLRLPQRSK